MSEPLRISVEIARSIWEEGIFSGEGARNDVTRCVDKRVKPLLDLLRESRNYVEDYAVKPENAAGKLLARIDAALRDAE